MTNEKLKEIEDRLFEKGNRRRDAEIKEIDAHARGYILGVNDALTAVSFVRPEQQNQPASETRTNLDRIRAMSAEKIAERWRSMDIACCKCPAKKTCPETGVVCNCGNAFTDWLNSPAKEDAE